MAAWSSMQAAKQTRLSRNFRSRCAPGLSRTANPRLRRPVLYPVELRAQRPGGGPEGRRPEANVCRVAPLQVKGRAREGGGSGGAPAAAGRLSRVRSRPARPGAKHRGGFEGPFEGPSNSGNEGRSGCAWGTCGRGRCPTGGRRPRRRWWWCAGPGRSGQSTKVSRFWPMSGWKFNAIWAFRLCTSGRRSSRSSFGSLMLLPGLAPTRARWFSNRPVTSLR